MAKMKPSQLLEADEIALKVLSQSTTSVSEWNLRETASVLQLDQVEVQKPNNWLQDLQISQHYLQQLVNLEDSAVALLNTDTLQLEVVGLDQVNKNLVGSLPAEASNNFEATR